MHVSKYSEICHCCKKEYRVCSILLWTCFVNPRYNSIRSCYLNYAESSKNAANCFIPASYFLNTRLHLRHCRRLKRFLVIKFDFHLRMVVLSSLLLIGLRKKILAIDQELVDAFTVTFWKLSVGWLVLLYLRFAGVLDSDKCLACCTVWVRSSLLNSQLLFELEAYLRIMTVTQRVRIVHQHEVTYISFMVIFDWYSGWDTVRVTAKMSAFHPVLLVWIKLRILTITFWALKSLLGQMTDHISEIVYFTLFIIYNT